MKTLAIIPVLLCFYFHTTAQSKLWHDKERTIHYRPVGKSFETINSTRRFNRALYGTNTAFRVEAGDLPEFALYLPGMGGNLKLGLIAGDKSKWLTKADSVKAVYSPGMMHYEITDPLLGKGKLFIDILALQDSEGAIIKTRYTGTSKNISLVWAFGGATGKRFSRDGDIGADPESSFDLKPENCINNTHKFFGNSFSYIYNQGTMTEQELNAARDAVDTVGLQKKIKWIGGVFPTDQHRLVNANKQNNPLELIQSKAQTDPTLLAGSKVLTNQPDYFLLLNAGDATNIVYTQLPSIFDKAKTATEKLANRIQVTTPDPYINTLGGVLATAADAIWEDSSYLHGAIAWRIRLPGWRGAYAADALGWHDRAKTHFRAYAKSQIITPESGLIVSDTALHMARQLEKVGTSMFSNGYICRNPNGDIRPHHYDMNLVYIDQLLKHFDWTGDVAFVREMWPVLERHLAWEKRNFDSDDDGLYDAYAAIWASDALQYNGGGVTHTSAYNYWANLKMTGLAKIIGKDATKYENEAEKIKNAIDNNLWLDKEGWYAEYKDKMGKQLVHPAAGLWTVYHLMDAHIPNAISAYQTLRYVDKHIPHIPVRAKGLTDTSLYVLSTTNWQPYTWSVNNVVLAENLHTALAYWQGNRPEEAFRIWKSSLVESMYLGASPGNIGQLLFYDAIRGELYRDFADPVGMAARSLVEGLFGIEPNALFDNLSIKPGFPSAWNDAVLKTPDIEFAFHRKGMVDRYVIKLTLPQKLYLNLEVPAIYENVQSVTVNGKITEWQPVDGVGTPKLSINVAPAVQYTIVIQWKGNKLDAKKASLVGKYHPLNNLTEFYYIKQGVFKWWHKKETEYLELSDITMLDEPGSFETVDLSSYYNDKVTNIFKQQYLSPRPDIPTLQLPWQGIGNWCYPLATAVIDDSGLRKAAASNNTVRSNNDVPFSTPSDTSKNNIVFTSLWDNYPDSIIIPLQGNAKKVHLLVAGTTNPMQSRFTNGEIVFRYKDGTSLTLKLNNPENWWPIEQDYYIDGYAFTTDDPLPERLYLKKGQFAKPPFKDYTTIRGFSNYGIDGGAATVLEFELSSRKELQDMVIKTIANDVVVGLMSLTLERP
jgi:hypothetical protein